MIDSGDPKVTYLESGPEDAGPAEEKLDLIREVLASGAVWAEPPPGVIEGVTAGIDTQQPVSPTIPRARRRLSPAWGVAAVLVIALFGVLGWIDRPPEDEAVLVAMFGTDIAPEAVGTAMVRETPAGWYIRLELEGLAPAPTDTYYQGWVWRESEGVSIGTFHLRGGAEPVALWSGVDPAEYPAIWVTLQADGGGAAASEQVVMKGRFGEASGG